MGLKVLILVSAVPGMGRLNKTFKICLSYNLLASLTCQAQKLRA